MSDDIEVHDTTETKAARQAMLDHLDAIPKAEIRELVDEWREKADALDEADQTDYGEGQRIVYERLSDELEAVLEEHE